jgi:hypothetical protein
MLRFLSSTVVRRVIRAETAKIETYNEFLDWVCFGGPVVKSGDPVEQPCQTTGIMSPPTWSPASLHQPLSPRTIDPCTPNPQARTCGDTPYPALSPGCALLLAFPSAGRLPSTISATDLWPALFEIAASAGSPSTWQICRTRSIRSRCDGSMTVTARISSATRPHQ